MTRPIDDLIREQLTRGVDDWERSHASGMTNTLSIRSLAGVARLLEHPDVEERAVRSLRAIPDRAFGFHAIGDVEFDRAAVDRLRSIRSLTQLDKEHPLCGVVGQAERVRSMAGKESHIALVLDGRFREAREFAKTGVRLEEVGCLFAVLGAFDAARGVADDPNLQPFRRAGVRFIILIELFRHGRLVEAEAALADQERIGLDAWGRGYLAMGMAGREPWLGYPFPDW